MRTVSVRGIPPAQVSVKGGLPVTRQRTRPNEMQLAQKKDRLERIRENWASHLRRTEAELRILNDRLASLPPLSDPPAPLPHRTTEEARRAGTDQEGVKSWRPVELEY